MDDVCYETIANIETRHFWHRGRRSIVKKIIRSQLKTEPKNILDIGCGMGANFALLSSLGKVDNMECSEEAVRHFEKKNPNVPIFRGALPEDLPENIRGKKYNLIVMLDVLEHIKEDVEALRALRPLLECSGSILLTVPACPSLYGEFDKVSHHYRRYSANALKKVVHQAGFTATYVNYFGFFLFPVLFARRFFQRYAKEYSFEKDNKVPCAPVNALLGRVFALERGLLSLSSHKNPPRFRTRIRGLGFPYEDHRMSEHGDVF